MGVVLDCTAEKYTNSAKKMLEKKDLLGFVENITSAIFLCQQDGEVLAEATFLRVKGLMDLSQHQKALEYVDEAISFNTGEKVYKLKEFKGKAKGYLGDLEGSISIFKELLKETAEINSLVDTYINIAWINLTVNKEKNEEALEEAKKYLDLAMEHFSELTNSRKWRVLNNLSIYYYYKKNFDKAIEMLESALEFCSERDQAYIYANLAEIALEYGDGQVSYAEQIKHYTAQTELIGTKYKDDIIVARGFYIRAMSELKENQLFTALDILYLALEYYRKAEAFSLAFDCLVRIYKIMDEYKIERLEYLNRSLNDMFKNSPLYIMLQEGEKR